MAVCSVIMILTGCANPFAPSEMEVVQGVHMQPSEVTLPIGTEQTFSVTSERGQLDEIRIYLVGTEIYNGECACDRYIKLGNLEEVSVRSYRYVAPTSVRDSIPLPLTFSVAAAYGDVGHGAQYKTLAYVTVTR